MVHYQLRLLINGLDCFWSINPTQSAESAIPALCLRLPRRPVVPACRAWYTPPMTTMDRPLPTHPTTEIVSAETIEPFPSSLSLSSLLLVFFLPFSLFILFFSHWFFVWMLFFVLKQINGINGPYGPNRPNFCCISVVV